MELTEHERRLVGFALEQFGEQLSQFLMAGFGTEVAVKSRVFSIEFTSSDGAILRRDIQLSVNQLYDASIFLPWMRDPLVILALLKLLLLEPGRTSANLFYEYEDVLNLLGWENTPESRQDINEAVERYTDLTYRWSLSAEELIRKNLAYNTGREVLVSGYSFVDLTTEDGEQMERLASRIDFSASFIEDLTRKALFEIDWNSVLSVTLGSASQT